MKWLLIFCGFIAWTGKTVSDKCDVTLSPSQIVVKHGDLFSANCSSSSNLMEGMGWESSQSGIPLTNGVSHLTLTVQSVTDWKIAPFCFFNLLDGTQCSHDLPVTVYKTPDSVKMSKPIPANPMVEGGKYRFECDVINVAPAMNLSVRWLIRNQLIKHHEYGDSTRTPVDKSETIEYTAKGDDNGAEIVCEVKLKFGPTSPNPPAMRSKSQELIIQYPPKINSPANVTLNDTERKDLTLDCTARGNPPPIYTWQLPDPAKEKMKNHKEAQLTLPWDLQFAGTYSCKASNDRGSSTKYFTIVQAPRDQTTLAAILGVGLFVAAVLLVIGAIFVTREGMFSCNRGSYTRGQPSSGPV